MYEQFSIMNLPMGICFPALPENLITPFKEQQEQHRQNMFKQYWTLFKRTSWTEMQYLQLIEDLNLNFHT